MFENPTGKSDRASGVLLALGNSLGSSLCLALIGVLISQANANLGTVLMFTSVFAFGFVQIPGLLYFTFVNRRSRAKLQALILTSSLLFLLNAGCYGVMLGAFRR